MPEIDVQDWCRNTEYTSGYDPQEPVIQVGCPSTTLTWAEQLFHLIHLALFWCLCLPFRLSKPHSLVVALLFLWISLKRIQGKVKFPKQWHAGTSFCFIDDQLLKCWTMKNSWSILSWMIVHHKSRIIYAIRDVSSNFQLLCVLVLMFLTLSLDYVPAVKAGKTSDCLFSSSSAVTPERQMCPHVGSFTIIRDIAMTVFTHSFYSSSFDSL